LRPAAGLATRDVFFSGTRFVAEKLCRFQLGIHLAYSLVAAEAHAFDSRLSVERVMRAPLVPGAPHLPGLTVFRLGLGNMAPSAATLFRQARYAEKLVLSYNRVRKTEDGLRPLERYHGQPVPSSLRGKLFAIGSEDFAFQSTRAGAGELIAHLEAIRTQGEKFGLDLNDVTALGHSAGNNDWVVARLALAANGFPRVIKRHIAVGAPLHGAAIAKAHPLGDAAVYLAGGGTALRALRDLSPAATRALIPDFMRETVDEEFMGVRTKQPTAEYHSWLMRLSALLYDHDRESDGLVDADKRFVKDRARFFIGDKGYDHQAEIVAPSAVEEWMQHASRDTDERTLRLLDTVV
jgi:hypothetical protein